MVSWVKFAGVILASVILVPVVLAQSRTSERKLIQSIDGKGLFLSYCASCHGKDGKGTGPMAASLRMPAADLTAIASRNHGVFPMAMVQRVIAGTEQPGTGVGGGHGSREMPVWGPIFSDVTLSPSGQDVDMGHVRINNLARYLSDLQKAK